MPMPRDPQYPSNLLWTGDESNSTGGWSFGVSLARGGQTCALVLESYVQPR